jgi:hypothetical protein
MPNNERKNDADAITASEARNGSASIFKLAAANLTLTAWLVFLGFGGALLTFYYMQISYFPEIAWQDSFTYLAAISLLGGGAVVTYGLLVFIPGVIWSEFLIFDTALRERFCCDRPNNNEPCYWTTILHLVVPFAIFVTLIHIARLFNPSYLEPAAIGGLTGLTIYYHLDFDVLLEKVNAEADRRSRRIKAVAAVDVATLASLTALLLIYHFVAPTSNSKKEWPLLIVCSLVVVVSNLLVAVQFRNKLPRAIVTGILAGLLLLFCGEILSRGAAAQSTRILERFGIGGRNLVTLLVSAEGQAILKKFELTLSPDSEEERIPNVRILSRLGKEYCLLIKSHRVILPKRAVISWLADGDPEGEPSVLPAHAAARSESNPWPQRVAGDLISLLAGAFFGWCAGKAAQRQWRRKHEPWQPLAAEDSCAVIPADSFSSLSISELALTELHAHFGRWGLSRKREIHVVELDNKLPGARVIVCPCSVRDNLSEMIHSLESKLRRAEVPNEYGLIYWMRSKNDPNRNLLVIAGNRNDLVQAGVRHVVSRSFLSLLDARQSEEHEVLVRVVDDGSGAQPEIQPVFLRSSP